MEKDIKDLSWLVYIAAGPVKCTTSPKVAMPSDKVTTGLLPYRRGQTKVHEIPSAEKERAGEDSMHFTGTESSSLPKEMSVSCSSSSQKSAERIQCGHISRWKYTASARMGSTENRKMIQDPANCYGKIENCRKRWISVMFPMRKKQLSQFETLIILNIFIQRLLFLTQCQIIQGALNMDITWFQRE